MEKKQNKTNQAFSSWIEKTMTKIINCHWKNRFVLQWYGAVRKFYQILYSLNYLTHIMSSYQEKIHKQGILQYIFLFSYILYFSSSTENWSEWSLTNKHRLTSFPQRMQISLNKKE